MWTISRRRFLQIAASGGAAVSLPWLDGCAGDNSSPGTPGPTPTPLPEPLRFFSAEERAIADRVAAALVPEGDGIAGAMSTGAVEYIDRYLAALEGPVPVIYRGGPYSGRWPFPDGETGEPSGDFPHNDFADVLPLTRLQDLAFRIELYGSESVANGDINAPLIAPWPGLRSIYREGLQQVGEPTPDLQALRDLEDEAVLVLFARTPREFQDAFLRNLGEGMFGAPEYGGNAGLRGWSDYQYDGDSQPLGHTLYAGDGTPRDRPDQPNQSEDPARPPQAFAAEVERFVTGITVAQGGTKFF